MRYWWANQNKTYKNEVHGGFLWSPKTKSNGARNRFYDNMCEIAVGDVVFSFSDTRIKAIGVVTELAQSSPKPDFGTAGIEWSNDGWLVQVEFNELSSAIRPKDHIALLRPHLPPKYSPLQDTGDGLQSVYLAAVPDSMAIVLQELIGSEYSSAFGHLINEVDSSDVAGNEHDTALQGRTDIGATEKIQLVKARRGQGVFKANVRLNETGCRITGITDPLHLRASHIKPWRNSTDTEKLNGCNGLLLAPHVDHLFDKGLISFEDDGTMLVSPSLEGDVLEKWGIPSQLNVGIFRSEQNVFLAYHRSEVFKN